MVGIDEVGRGCWAGPLLVVAARAKSELPKGLKDSKLMTKNQRIKILDLLSIPCEFGEGWVSATEIDKVGLANALRLGTTRALDDLAAGIDEEIILDGKMNYVPNKYINAKAKVGADSSIPIVSAASVYAKVTRDRYMSKLAEQHPGYSFDKHVGYGTKAHAQALNTHGIIEHVHRLSYSPIAKLAGDAI